MDEFSEYVPATTEFQVGYFSGRQSTKYWLMCQADLDQMNDVLKTGTTNRKLMLWCDGRKNVLESGPSTNSRKRSNATEPPPSKRQQIEDEVQEIFSQLKDKHGSKYSVPQLRLWARMVASKNHESLDNPPDIPVFSGPGDLPKKKTSLTDAITGAAMTLANAVRSPDITCTQNNNQAVIVSPSSSPTRATSKNQAENVGISPGRVSELRMKKLHELRELQSLLEQNILTQQEFQEQKQLVLDSLRKLTH